MTSLVIIGEANLIQKFMKRPACPTNILGVYFGDISWFCELHQRILGYGPKLGKEEVQEVEKAGVKKVYSVVDTILAIVFLNNVLTIVLTVTAPTRSSVKETSLSHPRM